MMTPVDELRQQWADAMATYGAVNVPPIEFLAHMIRISGEMQIELIERQDRTNALLSGGVIPALDRIAEALDETEAQFIARSHREEKLTAAIDRLCSALDVPGLRELLFGSVDDGR